MGTGLAGVGSGGVLLVGTGLEVHAFGEVELVAGPPPAVGCSHLLSDDQAGAGQGGDGSRRGVFGDADVGSEVADPDGRHPAWLAWVGGEGQILEDRPGQRP